MQTKIEKTEIEKEIETKQVQLADGREIEKTIARASLVLFYFV